MSENPYFSNEEAARRGQEAARMLESDVLRDAIAHAKRDLVAEWLETPSIDMQRACWAQVHALDRVIKALRGIEGDGQIAEFQIEAAQNQKQG